MLAHSHSKPQLGITRINLRALSLGVASGVGRRMWAAEKLDPPRLPCQHQTAVSEHTLSIPTEIISNGRLTMPTRYQTAVIWLSQHLAELKGEMNRAALCILRRLSVHMYLSERQKVWARLLSLFIYLFSCFISPPFIFKWGLRNC